MMKNKSRWMWLALVLVALVSLFGFAGDASASVTVTGYSYNQDTGDFTLNVKATEPWVVYRTVDFVHWERVSGVLGAGRKSFTDYGAGLDSPLGFYVAVPKNRKPNRGNHYGWDQPQNPHSD